MFSDAKDSQDSPGPFVGIDPDDTADVRVGGATFTIGVVDQGLWGRIQGEAFQAFEAAKRRAIKQLAGEGLDPDEVVIESEGRTVTRAVVDALNDPDYRERLYNAQCEAVRYAVRGHVGLVKRNGQAHPCDVERAKKTFGEVSALPDATVRLYRSIPGLVEALWTPIRNLQTLGEAEKKA